MGKLRARSQSEKDQRQLEVIAVAKKMFLTMEYEDISLAAISKELKITRPTLYNYFPSKEALFLELSQRSYLEMATKMKDTFQVRLEPAVFCRTLTKLFLSDKLFAKLLSLHQNVMKTKVKEELMVQFKTATLPFFSTFSQVIVQQFPASSASKRAMFMMQVNVLLTTVYDYTAIPAEQIEVMKKLKPFGEEEVPTALDFYSASLAELAQKLV